MDQSKDWRVSPTLVMVTSDELEHHHVANRILDDFNLDAIIVDMGPAQSRLRRIQYLLRRYTARQLLSRVFLRLASVILEDETRRRRELQQVFGPRALGFARPDLVQYVRGINTDAGRAAVSNASPDLLLVYGTGIVGRRVLDLAGHGAMNLHTGMSPEYRGSDCAFWPIYNHDHHLVGATVHECTARVDGGEVYERARAHIRPGDGRFAVFGRCVEVGAELYVAAIRRALDGRLAGEEQDPGIGREYRAADMRLRHDLYVRWLFRTGRVDRSTIALEPSRGVE